MNTMGGKESQLLKLLEPTVDMLGYKLWGIGVAEPKPQAHVACLHR